MAGHAPQSGNDKSTIHEFWELLTSKVRAAQQKHPWALAFCLLDASGRVGSVTSGGIGGQAPDKEDHGSSELRLFVGACALVVENSFVDAGPTWQHARGKWSRIDYVACCTAMHDHVTKVAVPVDIDLSLSVKEDHRPVMAVFDLSGFGADACIAKGAKHARINQDAARDPSLAAKFQKKITQFVFPTDHDVQANHVAFTAFVRKWALAVFGTAARSPRVEWMSGEAWNVSRLRSPTRRLLNQARRVADRARLVFAFTAWCGLVPAAFTPDGSVPTYGWGAKTRQPFHMLQKACALRVVAACERSVAALGWATQALCKRDKAAALHELQFEAKNAMLKGDFASAYRVTRCLTNAKPKPIQSVLRSDGSVTQSDQKRKSVWTDHLIKVYNGESVSDIAALSFCSHSAIPDDDHRFRPSLHQVIRAIAGLNGRRAIGPDEIDGFTLKAGGEPLARLVHQLIMTAITHEVVPISWKGDRAVTLYKGKGSPQHTDNYRILLIQDNLGKVFLEIVKDEVAQQYEQDNPGAQFGGVANGATDVPTHIVREFIAHAKSVRRSWAVIFLDLEKAFDKVIRELLMDKPHNLSGSVSEYFVSKGIAPTLAGWVEQYILHNGPILSQWQVDRKSARMLNTLHAGSWMRYDDADPVMSVTGGRQGCKLGGIVFGAIYAQAIKRVMAAPPPQLRYSTPGCTSASAAIATVRLGALLMLAKVRMSASSTAPTSWTSPLSTTRRSW